MSKLYQTANNFYGKDKGFNKLGKADLHNT